MCDSVSVLITTFFGLLTLLKTGYRSRQERRENLNINP